MENPYSFKQGSVALSLQKQGAESLHEPGHTVGQSKHNTTEPSPRRVQRGVRRLADHGRRGRGRRAAALERRTPLRQRAPWQHVRWLWQLGRWLCGV
jgi:hypothetical protein